MIAPERAKYRYNDDAVCLKLFIMAGISLRSVSSAFLAAHRNMHRAREARTVGWSLVRLHVSKRGAC